MFVRFRTERRTHLTVGPSYRPDFDYALSLKHEPESWSDGHPVVVECTVNLSLIDIVSLVSALCRAAHGEPRIGTTPSCVGVSARPGSVHLAVRPFAEEAGDDTTTLAAPTIVTQLTRPMALTIALAVADAVNTHRAGLALKEAHDAAVKEAEEAVEAATPLLLALTHGEVADATVYDTKPVEEPVEPPSEHTLN